MEKLESSVATKDDFEERVKQGRNWSQVLGQRMFSKNMQHQGEIGVKCWDKG